MIRSNVIGGVMRFFAKKASFTSAVQDASSEVVMELPKSSLVIRLFGTIYMSVTAIVGTITVNKIYKSKVVDNKEISVNTWLKFILSNAICIWIITVHRKVCSRIPFRVVLNIPQRTMLCYNMTPFLFKTREISIPLEWITSVGNGQSPQSFPIVYRTPLENFNRNLYIITENPNHPVIKYLIDLSNQSNQESS